MHSEKSNKEKYKRVEKGLHPIINTGGDTPQMTMIEQKLQQAVADALNRLYSLEVSPDTVVLQATKKEFTGDYTVVVFPYVKQARRSPEQVANELGAMVKESVSEVAGFNVIKGFLNFEIADNYEDYIPEWQKKEENIVPLSQEQRHEIIKDNKKIDELKEEIQHSKPTKKKDNKKTAGEPAVSRSNPHKASQRHQ